MCEGRTCSIGSLPGVGHVDHLSRVAGVCDGTVTDSYYPNLVVAAIELVDDPIGANPERTQTPKTSSQLVSSLGLAFEQPKRFGHRVRDRPFELEDLPPCSPSENDTIHLSMTGPGCDISTEVVECHRLAALDLSHSFFDRGEGVVVGEDLRRLFECLVLVDRDKDRCRSAAPGHDDVLTEIGNSIDETGEFTSQLADRHRSCHGGKCTVLSTHFFSAEGSHSSPRRVAALAAPPSDAIWYHMVMARTQTLVQLDDQLLLMLDSRAAAQGRSRSAIIRDAIEAYMAADIEAAIDQQIVAGYQRVPPPPVGADIAALAGASIEEEPW
jgi:predicted transcriptional regulator